MSKIESVVIVDNQYGSIATLRFDNPSLDRIISGSKPSIYLTLEKYIKKVVNV